MQHILQNPANGGTTPTDANFLVNGTLITVGAKNTINSLTLNAQSNVLLAANQMIEVQSGQILALPTAVSISGGTLSFGAVPAHVYNGGVLTIESTISGNAGLRKLGPGTLLLTQPAGYTGTTEISDGVVTPLVNGVFTNGEIDVYHPGILDIGPRSISIGALSGTGSVSIEGGSLTLGGAGISFIYFGGFTGSGQLTIESGGNPLAHQIFAGVSDFSGNVVQNSGIMELRITHALGTGNLTNGAGATLILDGSIDGTLDVAGSLKIGSSVSHVSTGALRLHPGSSLDVSYGFYYPRSDFDQIASSEAPELAGPISLKLEIPAYSDPVDDIDQFILIDNQSAFPFLMNSGSPLTFEGNPLSEGERFFAGGQEWRLSYQGGTGNDLVLFAVPEPATSLLLAASGVLLGFHRRRALPQH